MTPLPLDEIGARQGELDKLDTQLGDLIRRIEIGLRAHLAVRVEIPIDATYDLAFGKLDGAWCLIVLNGKHATPLIKAPRQLRHDVLVSGAVERLVRGAVEQIDRMITERESSLAAANSLAELLERTATP